MAPKPLAAKTIKDLEKTLRERRQELLDTATSMRAEAAEAMADQDRSDLLDEDPAPVTDVERTLMVSDIMAAEVEKIDGALERITKGTYGFCTSCGKRIGIERLRALPETELCFECASKRKV